MPRHPYPGDNKPQTTEEGGSVRYTIPAGVRDALDLGPGEVPESIEYDPSEREVALRFGSQD